MTRSEARGETAPRATVRQATLADLVAIMSIERASFLTPWPEEAIVAEICDNSFSTTLVAQIHGEIAGFMIFWAVEDERHLQNLAVDPAWRSRGIGRLLASHLIADSSDGHGSLITLEVRESNGPAKTLYRSLGFEVTGRRKGYYIDTKEDALLMMLDLRRDPRD